MTNLGELVWQFAITNKYNMSYSSAGLSSFPPRLLKMLTSDKPGDRAVVHAGSCRPCLKPVFHVSPCDGALSHPLIPQQQDFEDIVGHIEIVSVCHALIALLPIYTNNC